MCKDKYSDSEIKCPICGHAFINKGVGRVKEYCSSECKNLNSFINGVETLMNKIEFKSDDDKSKVKSKLFSVSNNLIIKTRKKKETQKDN